MKAWACVGSHGKIFACEISQDLRLRGRFEIYTNYRDARANAIGENYVREIKIVIPRKKVRK